MSPAKRKESQRNNLLLAGGVILVVLLAVILSQVASHDNPFSFLGAAVGIGSQPPVPGCVLEEEAMRQAEAAWTQAQQDLQAASAAQSDAEADKAYAQAVMDEKFDFLVLAVEAQNAARDALADAEASGDEGLIEEKSAELYTAIDAVAAANEEYELSVSEYSGAVAALIVANQQETAAAQAANDAEDELSLAEAVYENCVAVNGGG